MSKSPVAVKSDTPLNDPAFTIPPLDISDPPDDTVSFAPKKDCLDIPKPPADMIAPVKLVVD